MTTARMHKLIDNLRSECRVIHAMGRYFANVFQAIDVKKRFYVFYSGHVFTFFNVFFLFCQRFLFKKNGN